MELKVSLKIKKTLFWGMTLHLLIKPPYPEGSVITNTGSQAQHKMMVSKLYHPSGFSFS